MANILIIDDSIVQRRILRKYLEKGNYESIVEAKNGEEAILLYKTMKPDVVILDIVMPDANGIAILKNIIRHDRKANVIMCSAIAMQNIMTDSIHLGAKGFLLKPISADTLLKTVNNVMEMSKSV